MMRYKGLTWWVFLLACLAFCACEKEDKEVAVPEGSTDAVRNIQLGIGTTISVQEQATTRMSRTNTQADGQFRGIEYLRLIPFGEERTISKDDRSLPANIRFFTIENFQDPSTQEYPEVQKFYSQYSVSNSLFDATNVPMNTRSFLMYGHPTGGGVGDTSANKFSMGSLVLSGELDNTGNVDASSITFEPDQIYRESPADNTPYKTDKTTYDNAKQYAQLMVDFMNELAQTEYTPEGEATAIPWYQAPANSEAKELFDYFTHDGLTFTLGNSLLFTMLTNLYGDSNMPATLKTAMETMVASNKYKNYISLGDSKFSAKGNWKNFPSTGSLPNGLFVFKWVNETLQFVLLHSGNTSVNEAANLAAGTGISPQILNPGALAFPAQLWYYGNSTIHTRNSELTDEEIDIIIKGQDDTGQNGKVKWSSIDFDEYFDRNVVYEKTQSAVIDEPLNYGVSRLEVNAKMSTAPLTYNQPGGGTYSIPADAIQFKGIMVTNQHTAGFDFQPTDYAFNVLYDNNILNNRGTGNPFTLSQKIWDRNKVNILTLPSYPNEEVYIIAEFYLLQNKLDAGFKTKPLLVGNTNCEIYPNTTFYMIGKLDPNILSEEDLNGNIRQVLISDKCTTVTLVLSSLDGAYNYVPDVRSPSLTLGLDVVFDWEQADPETIWLQGE